MRIAIIGATGFIGRALIRQLLDTTNHSIVAFSRSADKHYAGLAPERLTSMGGDVFDSDALALALQNCDAAVYLIHMMNNTKQYDQAEAEAAEAFIKAARKAELPRVVYLGGLGDDSQNDLSKHLASRQRTGKLLRDNLPLVIELRASMIIGDGSVAYEILKAIARKLPILAVPRWTLTPTQPIILTDMLHYLQAALKVKTHSVTIGVGGPDIMTYRQVLARYATWAGHRQHVFAVPGVPRWAAAWWLRHFLPTKSGTIGRAMVDSLHYPMVVKDTRAATLFPDIKTQQIERGFTAQ